MGGQQIIHRNAFTDRVFRDFEHQLADCGTLSDIGLHLSAVVQRTIGASGIAVVPFFQENEATAPHVAVLSDLYPSEEAARSIIAALPMIDKELGPIVDILSRDIRTYCLEMYYGNQYLEKTETYNSVCRPLRAEQMVTAMMGTVENPIGLICISRSAGETRFSERDVALAESVRSVTERALFEVAMLKNGVSLHHAILTELARRMSCKCAVFDAEGHILWLNVFAEQELKDHVFQISRCYFICSENRTISAWREIVFHMVTENLERQKDRDGVSIERFQVGAVPLYLIFDETPVNHCPSLFAAAHLTTRETQIAEMVAEGYTPLNIASIHGISVGTVRIHLKNIYRKLNISSRMELARCFKP